MNARWLAVLILLPAPAFACKCFGVHSTCDRFQQAEVVFIGRVAAVEPPWNQGASPVQIREYERRLEQATSTEASDPERALLKLKALFADWAPPAFRARVQAAKNKAELNAIGEEISAYGIRMTLRPDVVYKGPVQDSYEVWTDLSSCGTPLQVGETYLVFASSSEKGRLSIGVCGGWATPLREAGDALAYLHFVRNGGESASRFYGSLTNNEKELRVQRFGYGFHHPAKRMHVVVESAGQTRHTETDDNGDYVMDGLRAGSYRVSVYDWKSDGTALQKATVQVPARGCQRLDLYVPPGKTPPR